VTENDWLAGAACIGQDPELFFPVGPTGPAVLQVHQATQVCADCSVRTSCLDLALATDAEYGIWGGLTEEERRWLRRPPARHRSSRDGDGVRPSPAAAAWPAGQATQHPGNP
jgi:WhiB family redox-sensing transcriptional regulator